MTDSGNGAPATPTGTVSFSSDSHGTFGNPGASCALSQVSPGQASCHVDYTPSALDSGTHKVTASYGGDGTHSASNGHTNVTVTAPVGAKRPTSTSLLCFPATLFVGGSALCRASVTDTGNGPLVTPTGTVSFSSNSHGTFAGPSCTVQPVNAATAGCNVTYTPTALDSGTHGLSVAYSGDAVHDTSTGGGSISVVPRPPSPPQNTALPSIVPDQSCQFYLHRFSCQTIPYQYFCEPGQWVGSDPSMPYRFEWDQLYYIRQGNFLANPFWRAEPNGSGQSFDPVSHVTPFDILHGYVASGAFRCVVTATGRGGSTAANSPAVRLQLGPSIRIPRPAPVNIVVTGIEVTQAVQSSGCAGCAGLLPSRDQSRIDTPGQATYQGVTMAAGKWTMVRVYAHLTGGTPATLSGATAQLELFDSNGNRTATLNPDSSPAQLTQPTCFYCVDPTEVAKPGSSFNFLVPWQETDHQALTFRATVTPRYGPLLPAQCAGCRGNTFTLSSVPFIPTATVPIKPLPLAVSTRATNCQTPGTTGCGSTSATNCGGPGASACTNQTPQQVFGDTTIVLPEQFQIYPYRPLLVVGTQENACQAATDVSARDGNDGITVNEYGVGVFFKGEGAMAAGCTAGGFTLFNNGAASAVQDAGRSLTSVTHEIGHGLGLVHADKGSNCGTYRNASGQTFADPSTGGVLQTCPGPHSDGTPDCGGNTNGQAGETWPPGPNPSDNEGRLDSFGLDRRAWDIFTIGSLPSTFVEGFGHDGSAAAGTRYYDLMSYCGDKTNFPVNFDADHWISLFNWNRLLNYHAPANNLPAAADQPWRAVQGTPLRVMAIVDSDGNTSIVHVMPGQKGTGGSTPGSPYRIELRDRGGHVLDSAVPLTGAMHVDYSGKQPELLLDATLPFVPATGSVAVSVAGQDVASRVRSVHAPTAKFLSPRRGSQLGKTRTTFVRWLARDADGDRLTSTVEYSRDAGRHWTVVADGLTGNSARVPSRFLSASGNARLRVLVSDGFDLTTVTSGRLRARGVPPIVQILNAPRRGHVLDTTTLLLQGSAFDDADRSLAGRHLKWYLGKRRIGTGDR